MFVGFTYICGITTFFCVYELMLIHKIQKVVVAKASRKVAKGKGEGRTKKARPEAKKAARISARKFIIDCSKPVADGIMDPATFVCHHFTSPSLYRSVVVVCHTSTLFSKDSVNFCCLLLCCTSLHRLTSLFRRPTLPAVLRLTASPETLPELCSFLATKHAYTSL